jgi:hypothetical protein
LLLGSVRALRRQTSAATAPLHPGSGAQAVHQPALQREMALQV